MAAKPAVPPCHHPRALPKCPGINASAMGWQQPIGHTPWRVQVSRDIVTGAVLGKPKPAARLEPRPTGGTMHGRSKLVGQQARKGSKRTAKSNNSRAARAARSRNAAR